MASVNAVIVPTKVLKNGRHKIRISLAHNGETRYISTDITVDSVKEFKNGSVVRRPDASYLNTKLRGILQEFQEALDKVPYKSSMTCAEVVAYIKMSGRNRLRTLESICTEYIKVQRIKPSTAKIYSHYWNTISQLLPKGIMVENVTYSTILSL